MLPLRVTQAGIARRVSAALISKHPIALSPTKAYHTVPSFRPRHTAIACTVRARTPRPPTRAFATQTSVSASNSPFPAYQFPPNTILTAGTRNAANSLVPSIADALRTHGIIVIQLGFSDPDSSYITELVQSLGCSAQTHSAHDGVLWDVTWSPEESEAGVWSRSMDEMSWHTDGSFEATPMRWFGFHVVRADREGGGVFQVAPAEEVVRRMGADSVDVLKRKEFDLKVPDEFDKGLEGVKGQLLQYEPDEGWKLRYRSNVVGEVPSADAAANEAVGELRQVLHGEGEKGGVGDGSVGGHLQEGLGWAIPTNVMRDNSIILMDNARVVHSRTKILDRERLLRRIRFTGTPVAKIESAQTWSQEDTELSKMLH